MQSLTTRSNLSSVAHAKGISTRQPVPEKLVGKLTKSLEIRYHGPVKNARTTQDQTTAKTTIQITTLRSNQRSVRQNAVTQSVKVSTF